MGPLVATVLGRRSTILPVREVDGSVALSGMEREGTPESEDLERTTAVGPSGSGWSYSPSMPGSPACPRRCWRRSPGLVGGRVVYAVPYSDPGNLDSHLVSLRTPRPVPPRHTQVQRGRMPPTASPYCRNSLGEVCHDGDHPRGPA